MEFSNSSLFLPEWIALNQNLLRHFFLPEFSGFALIYL